MLSGSMVALITPFRDGQIDWAALDRLVDMQIEGGTDVLVPCGTTGESPTLSHEEHEAVIDAVIRRAAGRVPVLAGTGSNSTDEAIHLTKYAKDSGAAGSLQVAPYYNKPTQEGMYRHFAAIVEATDGFPMVLYNIPGRCGVEISIETIVRLHRDFPCIVAVKHATGSIDGASALAAACDIDLISGDDSMTWPLMAIGGKGVISVLANLLPREVKALTQAGLKGCVEEARRRHFELLGLCKIMFIETNPIPIKTAMAMKGLCAEEFRLPMCPMAPANREKLQKTLKQYNVL